jgi:polar amino acid transport system substrate-binding protein
MAKMRIQACCFLLLALAGSVLAESGERVLRVAVLTNSPPMSYTDQTGKLAGFNVGVARALCAEMKVRCELSVVELADVVDAVAAGKFDFSAVSLLTTPERQAKVLFSKPYYRSNSIWFAQAGVEPGAETARVAAVAGSAQYRYAKAQGWNVRTVDHHSEFPALLSEGRINAVLIPMATSLTLRENPSIQPLGLKTTVLQAPELSGDVCYSVDPKKPELRDRINAAFDQIKRDGRFDRLNTEYLPFRLQ